MKKTTTSNPLKFFNDAKEARNKSFSKSLIKANNGRITGPMTQQEAAAETAATSYPGPYANSTPAWSSQDKANIAKAVSELARPVDYLKDNIQRVNNINMENERASNSNSGAMQATSRRVNSAPYEQKKGGVVNRIGGVKKNASKKK
jgi:hypothetical protein